MRRNIQYGAGLCGPADWENYDSSPMIILQRTPILRMLPAVKRGVLYPRTVKFGDVLRGLPVPTGSADNVYCSHVLEHFTRSDCRRVLLETRRMLRSGGTFRGVMPDLRKICGDYLRSSAGDAEAAARFMNDSGLGLAESPRGLSWVRHTFFSRSIHFWLWDYAAIETELRDAGFSHVRPASFRDSDVADFLSVEDSHRWAGALGFEAR